MLPGEDLGQRQVEAALGARPGAHRRAEARASRGAAVDGDEEGTLPARTVVALDVGALQEDTVLDGDRVQVARADAEEGERPVRRRLLGELRPAVVAAARLPHPDASGQQPALPRVRPDRVAEARLVVPTLEPVGRGVLHLRPAGRQLVGGSDLLVDDRAFAARRPDDAIAAVAEYADERVQPVEIDDGGSGTDEVGRVLHGH